MRNHLIGTAGKHIEQYEAEIAAIDVALDKPTEDAWAAVDRVVEAGFDADTAPSFYRPAEDDDEFMDQALPPAYVMDDMIRSVSEWDESFGI